MVGIWLSQSPATERLRLPGIGLALLLTWSVFPLGRIDGFAGLSLNHLQGRLNAFECIVLQAVMRMDAALPFPGANLQELFGWDIAAQQAD